MLSDYGEIRDHRAIGRIIKEVPRGIAVRRRKVDGVLYRHRSGRTRVQLDLKGLRLPAVVYVSSYFVADIVRQHRPRVGPPAADVSVGDDHAVEHVQAGRLALI